MPQPSVLGGSLFGGASHPSSGANNPQAEFEQLQARVEEIVQAWNPRSPNCRFQVCDIWLSELKAAPDWVDRQHYFYNLVDPNQVNLYGRPPNATDEALWQKAVRENPARHW